MSELVSIITPSYNSAAYIAEMIESGPNLYQLGAADHRRLFDGRQRQNHRILRSKRLQNKIIPARK